MEVPVRCGRCGTVHGSGLVIPPESLLRWLQHAESTPDAFRGPFARCPTCNSLNSPSALVESHAVGHELHRASSDLREIRDLISELETKIYQTRPSPAVDDVINKAHLSAGGLSRLIPQGQANVLAFLALVVSIATLVEQTLVDVLSPGAGAERSSQPGNGQSDCPGESAGSLTLDVQVDRYRSGLWISGIVNSRLTPYVMLGSSVYDQRRRAGRPADRSGDRWDCHIYLSGHPSGPAIVIVGLIDQETERSLTARVDRGAWRLIHSPDMRFTLFGPAFRCDLEVRENTKMSSNNPTLYTTIRVKHTTRFGMLSVSAIEAFA